MYQILTVDDGDILTLGLNPPLCRDGVGDGLTVVEQKAAEKKKEKNDTFHKTSKKSKLELKVT